ncbi:Lipase (class 2) [Amycolatopsis xylanica]|uniref:Lipase (Class 2) n=1 Tax=Amycolatopsis xylanica TaxID=589385 RepID=A0A1H2ZB73_9PSEU|nr:alpha/beta fold hydrolase [Amycolatopsis xylanica]SDX14631.1 Lipase (class 2) [Amycolatopsis xylanica]
MRTVKSLSAVILATLLALVSTPAARAASLPVPWNLLAALPAQLANPGGPPPGANDWSCRPSAAHPSPVVLVHGLGANQTVNWQTYSPLLKNNGYCVFSLTYGVPGEPLPVYQPGGLVRMEDSAAEFSRFVDKVLDATGAAKVSILGHSEGTVMPSYYVKFLGGASKVDKYVGLTPLWDGTTLYGLSHLYKWGQVLVDPLLNPLCGSCVEFLQGSDFLTKMKSGNGQFQPGVAYTNIVTRYDELVIPYTSGKGTGPNVRNIVLQDTCPLDFAEHAGLAADRNAAGHVLNALDPAHPRPVPCHPAGPLGS